MRNFIKYFLIFIFVSLFNTSITSATVNTDSLYVIESSNPTIEYLLNKQNGNIIKLINERNLSFVKSNDTEVSNIINRNNSFSNIVSNKISDEILNRHYIKSNEIYYSTHKTAFIFNSLISPRAP